MSRQFADRVRNLLAISALLVYTIGELLLVYTTAPLAFSFLKSPYILAFVEDISIAAAVAAIALKSPDYGKRQIILFSLALSLIFFSATRTGDFRLVHIFIIIIAVADIDIRKLCLLYSLAILSLISFTMLLSEVGLISIKDFIPNSRLVFSYGFAHPNALGGLLFSSLTAMCYACWDESFWWMPLGLSLVSALFSYCLLSSHAPALMLFFLSCMILLGHVEKINNIRPISNLLSVSFLVTLPVVLSIIILLCVALFDSTNPFLCFLDNLFHGRIYFAHKYFEDYGGFTLFGREYVVSDHYHTGLAFGNIDSGFCYLSLVTGIIPTVFLFFLYIFSVLKFLDDEHIFQAFFIILFCIMYLAIESYPLYLPIGVLPLFSTFAFSSNNSIVTFRKKNG